MHVPPPPPLQLMLPDGVTVEVIVVNQVNAGHLFVQQHTHPTFHALRSLDQQMYLCYSQPGIPTLPTPVESKCCPRGLRGTGSGQARGEVFRFSSCSAHGFNQQEAVLGLFMGIASLSSWCWHGVHCAPISWLAQAGVSIG